MILGTRLNKTSLSFKGKLNTLLISHSRTLFLNEFLLQRMSNDDLIEVIEPKNQRRHKSLNFEVRKLAVIKTLR